MGRPYSSRTLLIVCGALMVLLAALAVVQYRWSTRVAAADAQREKEHLDSAASLFASELNGIAAETVHFLENDARSALQSGGRLATVPKLIAELYYLDVPARGAMKASRLAANGVFTPSPLPPWIETPRCTADGVEQPALVVPVYMATAESGESGTRILRTFRWQQGRCFVARLDQTYLRDALFPPLIRRSFGPTAAQEYDFEVASRDPSQKVLYGRPLRADLRQPFFSFQAINLAFQKPLAGGSPEEQRVGISVRHVESTIVTRGGPPLAGLFGRDLWELDVAHKGMPLAAAFEQTRRRNWLLSLGVEVLLAAAIVFLVIASRRMQRLADQKMQFIAGVSHELRSPVSAIAMLSRNQADGLVAGAERVKQYGELMHQQSRRLNEMVEQTLQYAGIHSSLRRPAKSEIDLPALIREAVEARREELARGGFEVEIALDSDLPVISGDPALLRTAFDNLLSNAQKHAGSGHWIRVSGRYSALGKEVRISVEDRGAGIGPADQAEIFEPFYRGRAAVESQIPGSGLGLSLVRSAAEAHRGSVTLVSEPGRGSTFTLHLPV